MLITKLCDKWVIYDTTLGTRQQLEQKGVPFQDSVAVRDPDPTVTPDIEIEALHGIPAAPLGLSALPAPTQSPDAVTNCHRNGPFIPMLHWTIFAFSAYMDSRDGLLKILVLGDHRVTEDLPLYCLIHFSAATNKRDEMSVAHLERLGTGQVTETR